MWITFLFIHSLVRAVPIKIDSNVTKLVAYLITFWISPIRRSEMSNRFGIKSLAFYLSSLFSESSNVKTCILFFYSTGTNFLFINYFIDALCNTSRPGNICIVFPFEEVIIRILFCLIKCRIFKYSYHL